jgi:hypothetical protein
MKIGFVTCAAEKLDYFFPTLAEPDFIPIEPPFTPDDQLAVNQLRKHGFDVKPIVWGSSIAALHDIDLIIIRSPWDYMDTDENKKHFLEWVSELEKNNIRVANPSKLMQWMLDKHYLACLASEGIQVIPTRYYEKGALFNLGNYFEEHGEFIAKPCISAAGKGLYHIHSLAEANNQQDSFNKKLKTSSYMIQDFIPEITTEGEWSLIFIGGKYSHAIHKKPAAGSILVHAERGGSLRFGLLPNQRMIAFANCVYAYVLPAFTKATREKCDPNLMLYLRLDIIETQNGPVLIECEGVEPELFFRAYPSSTEVFCQAVFNCLGSVNGVA